MTLALAALIAGCLGGLVTIGIMQVIKDEAAATDTDG